jgi:uncharacterized membrane protein
VDLFFRWLHVLAGITWIGHLYFFNFVNVPFQATMDAATKKLVNPQLIPRALWWFRWGAMITFIAGVILFIWDYVYPGNLLTQGTGTLTARSIWIIFGMALATIMWFNVWFIIWPAQKKILSAVRDGTPAPPPNVGRRAYLASRTNSYLSGPMLFGMLAPNHFSDLSKHWMILIASVLGLIAIWGNIKASPAVGKKF